jgi:hypothetical protein
MVFTIRMKRPQTAAERCWNAVQDVLSLSVVFTPIVLKLTGVITWSWWWVALSPVWMSAALQVLLVTGLAIVFPRTRRAWPEIEAGNQDAPGGRREA